jgi:hypothetical protein
MTMPVDAPAAEAAAAAVGLETRRTLPPNPETLLPVIVQAEAEDARKKQRTRRQDVDRIIMVALLWLCMVALVVLLAKDVKVQLV